MKKIAMVAAFLAACFFGTGVCSLVKSANAKGPGRAFCGRVAQVNVVAETLFVKEGGNTVGFDVSNPVFSGYSSLSAVKIGDRVAVSYTTGGTRVVKLTGPLASSEKEKAQAVGRPSAGGATQGKRQTRLIRREKNGDTTGFCEADVNGDGKITPVGLSVVIKDVTMDEFRQYDKGHKGYLNKAEFLEAVRSLRARER